jgi:hypothetical protein
MRKVLLGQGSGDLQADGPKISASFNAKFYRLARFWDYWDGIRQHIYVGHDSAIAVSDCLSAGQDDNFSLVLSYDQGVIYLFIFYDNWVKLY